MVDHDHDHEHEHDHDHEHGEQTVTVQDAGPAKKKLMIEIPPQRIQGKLDETLDSLQTQAAIPGFRPGHAPRRLLEKKLGSDLRQEVANRLISESFSQAVEEEDLHVLGEPELPDARQITLPDSGPLDFEATVEVMPPFTLPDTDRITVKKPSTEVSDEQVDERIENYREMYGDMESAQGPVRTRDYLTADVQIRSIEGEVLEEHEDANVFVPGETPNNYRGVVTGVIVDDLGRRLQDKNLQDQVEIEARGPQKHQNEQIQDERVLLTITIKGIQRVRPLSMEQMLESAGLDSEDEIRLAIRQNLENQAQNEQRQTMREQVREQLPDQVDVEIPQSMKQQEAQRVAQQQIMQAIQGGQVPDDIQQHMQQAEQSAHSEAERKVKTAFILTRFADELQVEVSEAELNQQIMQIATQKGIRPERARRDLQEQGRLDSLRLQLQEQKTLDRLVDRVQVQEVTREQWEQEQEEKERREQQQREQEQQAQASEEQAPTDEQHDADEQEDQAS